MDLEHDPNVGRQRQALSIGQGKQLVVVQDGVEVLHPLGVDVAVKDDPLSLVNLTPDVVDNAAEDVGEQAITPLPRVGVQHSVELLLGQGLGVDHVGHTLHAFQSLQSLQQDPEKKNTNNK